MDTQSEWNQLVFDTNKPAKWWHQRRAKIIGISFVIFVALTISVVLILEFSIWSPKNSYSTTTTTAQPSVWRSTGNMNTRREGHVAILLKNGKVLVTGGSDH
ncbi:unnamed protein product, partial [Adineta steineri]